MTWVFPPNGDNGSPLREFLIEYKSDFYDQVRVYRRIADTAARYVIINFSPWVIYQLRVVAVNGIGRGVPNTFITFSTKDVTAGKMIENLSKMFQRHQIRIITGSKPYQLITYCTLPYI